MNSGKISLKEGFDFLFEEDEVKKEKVTKFNIQYSDKNIDTNNTSNQIAFILALDIVSAAINKQSDTILTKNFYSDAAEEKDSFFVGKVLDFTKLQTKTKNVAGFTKIFSITQENQNKSVQALFDKYKECIDALTDSSISGIMLTEAESQPVKISLQRYKKMVLVLKNTAALPKDNRGNKINFNLLFKKILEYIANGQLFKQGGGIDQEFKELSNHEKLLYGFQKYLKTLSRYQKQNIRMNVIKTFMSDLSDGEKDIKDIYNDFVSSMGDRTSGKMKRAIKDLTKDLISADSVEDLKTAVVDAASVAKEEEASVEAPAKDQTLEVVMGNAPVTFKKVSVNNNNGLHEAVSMILTGELYSMILDSGNSALLINKEPKTLVDLTKISINLRDILSKKGIKEEAGSDLLAFTNAIRKASEALGGFSTKISLLEETGLNYKLEVSYSAVKALLEGIKEVKGEFNVGNIYSQILPSANTLSLSFGNYQQEPEEIDLPPEVDLENEFSQEKYQKAAKEDDNFKDLLDDLKTFVKSVNKIDQKVLSPEQAESEFSDLVDQFETQVMTPDELEQYKPRIKDNPVDGVGELLDQALSNIDDGSQSSEETDPDEDEDDPSSGFFDKVFLKANNQQIEAKRGEFVKVKFDSPVSVKRLVNSQGEKETINVIELAITHKEEEDEYYLECSTVSRDRKPNKTLSWENLVSHKNIPDRLVVALNDAFKGGDEEKSKEDDLVIETALSAPTNYTEFMKQVVVYSSVAIRANNQFLSLFDKPEYTVEQIVELFEAEISKLASKMSDNSSDKLKKSINNFKSYGDKQINKLLVEEENQGKVSLQIRIKGKDSLKNCAVKLISALKEKLTRNESLKPNLLVDYYDLMGIHNILPYFKIVQDGKETNTSIDQVIEQLSASESITHTVEDNTITLTGDGEELLQINPVTNIAYVANAFEQTDSTVVEVPALEDRPAEVIQAACNNQLKPEDLKNILQGFDVLRDDVSASVDDEDAAASGLTSSELSDIARQKDPDTPDSDDSEEASDNRGELSLDDFKSILNNSFKKFYPDQDRIIDSFNKYNQKRSYPAWFENDEDFKSLKQRSLLVPVYKQDELALMLPRPDINAIRPFIKDAYQNEMQVVFDSLYRPDSKFVKQAFVSAYTNLITNATYRAIGENNSNDRVAEVLGEGLFDALKRSSSAGLSWLPKLGKGMAIMTGAKIAITAMGGAALIGPIIGTLGLMGFFSAGMSIKEFQKAKKQYAKNPLKYIEETVFNDHHARIAIANLVENAIAKQIFDIINGTVKKSKLDMNALSLKNVQNSIDGYVDYYSGLSDADKKNLKEYNDFLLDAMKCTSLYENEIINESTINIIFNKLFIHEKGVISNNPDKAKNYSKLFEEILKAIDETSFKANFTNWTENEVRLVTSGKSKSSNRFQIEYRDEIKDKKQLFISPDQISTDYINYLFSKAFGVFLDDVKKEIEIQETLQEGLYFNPDFAIKGSLTKLLFEDSKIMLNEEKEEEESSSGSTNDLSNYIKTLMCALTDNEYSNMAQVEHGGQFDMLDSVKSLLISEAGAEPVLKAVSQTSAEVDSNVKVSDSFSAKDLAELNILNKKLGLPELKTEDAFKDYAEGVSKAIASPKSDNIDQATAKKLASKLSDLSSDETMSKIKGAVPFIKSFSSALTSQSGDSASALKVVGSKFGYVSSPAEAMQYQKMHFDPIIKEILIKEGGRQKILQFFMSSQESLHGKAEALGCVKIDLSNGTSQMMGSGPQFQENYVDNPQNADYLERLGVVFKGGDGTGKLPELADGGPAKELSPDDILSKKGLNIVLNSLKGSVKQVYEASETAVKKLALKSSLDNLGGMNEKTDLGAYAYKVFAAKQNINFVGGSTSEVGKSIDLTESPVDVLKMLLTLRVKSDPNVEAKIAKFLDDPQLKFLGNKLVEAHKALKAADLDEADRIVDGSFFKGLSFDFSFSSPEDLFSAPEAEVDANEKLLKAYEISQEVFKEVAGKKLPEYLSEKEMVAVKKVIIQTMTGSAKSQGYNPLYKSLVEDIANKTGKTAEEVVSEVSESDATGLTDPNNNILISSDKSGGSTETIEKFAAAKAEQVKAELINNTYDSEVDPMIKDLKFDDASKAALDKVLHGNDVNSDDPITNNLSSKFENIFDQELNKQLNLNNLDAEQSSEVQQIITNAVKSPDTSSAAGAASKINLDAVQKAASKAADGAAAKAAPKIEQTLKDNGVGQEEAKQAADAIVQKVATKAKIDAIEAASKSVSEDDSVFSKMMDDIKNLQNDSKEVANKKVIQKVLDTLDGDETSEINNAIKKLSKTVQNVAQKAVNKEVGDSSITSGIAKSSLTDSILKTLSDPDGLIDSTYTSYAAIGGILSKIASKFWTRGIKGGDFAKQFVAAAKPERMLAVIVAQAFLAKADDDPNSFHNKYGNNRPKQIQKAVDDFTKGVNPSLIKFKFDPQEDESIDLPTIEQASELVNAKEQVSERFVYKTSISNFLFEGLVTKKYDINENLNLNSYRKEINDHNNLIKEFKNFFK